MRSLRAVDAGVVDELGPLVERAAGLRGEFIGPLPHHRDAGMDVVPRLGRACGHGLHGVLQKRRVGESPTLADALRSIPRHMMGGGGWAPGCGLQLGAGGVGAGSGVHEGAETAGGRLGHRGAGAGFFLAGASSWRPASSWRSPCWRTATAVFFLAGFFFAAHVFLVAGFFLAADFFFLAVFILAIASSPCWSSRPGQPATGNRGIGSKDRRSGPSRAKRINRTCPSYPRYPPGVRKRPVRSPPA